MRMNEHTSQPKGCFVCEDYFLCRAVLFIGRNEFHFIRRRTVHFHVVAQSVSTDFRTQIN